MLRLMLLRHAKSDWPDAMSDLDRPLAPRGREAAPRIGGMIAAEGLVPQFALVSPARRTRETWSLVAAQWPEQPSHEFDERLYETTAPRLLELVRARPDGANDVMIVGHNPSMHELALALVGSGKRKARDALASKFPTAALAVIEFFVQHWREVGPHTGHLAAFVTPRALGDD